MFVMLIAQKCLEADVVLSNIRADITDGHFGQLMEQFRRQVGNSNMARFCFPKCHYYA